MKLKRLRKWDKWGEKRMKVDKGMVNDDESG
jgi:hypothetical protein